MTLLDRVLQAGVRRLLLDAGYEGRGRTLRTRRPDGSSGVIELKIVPTAFGKSTVSFEVEFAVFVPPKVRPWLSDDLQQEVSARRRPRAKANVLARLLPSPASAFSRLDDSHDESCWVLDAADSMELASAELSAGLRDVVLPLLNELLDASGGPATGAANSPRVKVLEALAPFSWPRDSVGGGLYAWPESNPTSAPSQPAPARALASVTNDPRVRIQADQAWLAVEIDDSFTDVQTELRAVGARRLTRDGSFTAELDPKVIWLDINELVGVLHIRTPGLAAYDEITFPHLSQGLVDLAAVFPVCLVISLGGSLLPGLNSMKIIDGSQERTIWGGLLTTFS